VSTDKEIHPIAIIIIHQRA